MEKTIDDELLDFLLEEEELAVIVGGTDAAPGTIQSLYCANCGGNTAHVMLNDEKYHCINCFIMQ